MNLSLCSYLSSALLGTNMPLCTMLSDISSVCSALDVIDHVPYDSAVKKLKGNFWVQMCFVRLVLNH